MPRVPVRPLVAAVAAAAASAALAGCAGIGQPAPYDSPGINGLVIPTTEPAPADFVDRVDNPWLALEPGSATRLDVRRSEEVVGSLVVTVQTPGVVVAGLAATAVRTVTTVDGEASDVTRFYAQDRDGNVWLVGADTAAGSWRAGDAGAEAGLAMPADPRLGDGWVLRRVPGEPDASRRVEDRSATVALLRDADGGSAPSLAAYERGVGLVGVEQDDWQAVPTG